MDDARGNLAVSHAAPSRRREFRRCLDLVLYKSYAEMRAEAQRNYLGVLWWIVEPVLYMGVLYFVFGVLMPRRAVPDFVPFLLIGLVVWKWFDSSVRSAATAIVSNAPLARQVYIPKIVFPTISATVGAFKFLVAFLVLAIFVWIYGLAAGIAYLSLPAILVAQLIFTLGIAYPLSGATPFLPDLAAGLEHAMRMWFFLSGIFFAGASLENPSHRRLFYLNPMAHLIEAYRDVMLYGRAPNYSALAAVAGLGLAGILIGYFFIRRFDGIYPKLIP